MRGEKVREREIEKKKKLTKKENRCDSCDPIFFLLNSCPPHFVLSSKVSNERVSLVHTKLTNPYRIDSNTHEPVANRKENVIWIHSLHKSLISF